MNALDEMHGRLLERQHRWLVTGGAGFIGSHLVETLLASGQVVTTLDNFSTGHRHNLIDVAHRVGGVAWKRHRLLEGDIADIAVCNQACQGIDIVLHQAALGSVPRSLADPTATHRSNATGFLNMLVAARESGVERFVYAASSSTYGDSTALPKVEDTIGAPLSPYAVTKLLNELYAGVFARCYGLHCIGLRYFNVFGPRQDPEGAYAAVIPRWARAMLREEACTIHGDGETSRDFCYVGNAVQANLRAALAPTPDAWDQVYNVAVGERCSLKQLHGELARALEAQCPGLRVASPRFADFRAGDVRHSLADISKARCLLGYRPTHTLVEGLVATAPWYARHGSQDESPPRWSSL